MARTQTLVQLTDRLVALLDEEAADAGVSRSALIRRILDDHLAERASERVGREIVEGYTRVPPGEPDGWADLDDVLDRAQVDTLQRLDAEEAAAGHDPW